MRIHTDKVFTEKEQWLLKKLYPDGGDIHHLGICEDEENRSLFIDGELKMRASLDHTFCYFPFALPYDWEKELYEIDRKHFEVEPLVNTPTKQ